MTRSRQLFAVLAAIGFFASSSAYAAPVVWDLSGVTFNDGAIATGSFTYDVDTNSFATWSISTSGGSILSPYTYDTSGYASDIGPNDFFFTVVANDRYLRLGTATALTDAGGTVALLTGLSSYECNNCGAYRTVTAGSLVAQSEAVPEPAAWAMMVAGFAIVGVGLRRQRTNMRIEFA